ncbi:putative biotin transporter BioY [[Clostridium] ultunense Esp]|nr:putative biotin transporter BioY [[Clostridium] ultunense Esp]
MRFRTVEMAYVALFVALSVVSIYLVRILPPVMVLGVSVPISLMPMISALAGALLGGRLGVMAMFLYLLLGLIGLPVYAEGKGGLIYIVSPTFGFILGYLLSAYVSAWLVRRKKSLFRFQLGMVVSLLPLYAVGILYMWAILGFYLHKEASLIYIALGMIPYFIKDVAVNLLFAVVAYGVTKRVNLAAPRVG